MSKRAQDPNLKNLQMVSILLDYFIFFFLKYGKIANLDFMISFDKLNSVLTLSVLTLPLPSNAFDTSSMKVSRLVIFIHFVCGIDNSLVRKSGWQQK